MAMKNSNRQGKKTRKDDGPSIYAWLLCIIGIGSTYAVAYIPDLGPFSFLTTIYLFVFRTIWTTRLVAHSLVAAHIADATYAWFLATRVDRENRTKWFWQTLVLGLFSLRFLLKKARK